MDFISILHGNVLLQYKCREKDTKVVDFVAKWLNLCLSTVIRKEFFVSSRSHFKGLFALFRPRDS